MQPFRYELDTLRSESTASLRTLHDPQIPVLSTGQNSVVVRRLSMRSGSEPCSHGGVDIVQDAFLTDDDGLPLLGGIQRYRSAQKSRPPTTGIRLARIRSAPTPSNSKAAQRQSIIANTNNPTVTLPLEILCDLIARCSSLERTQILTVELHKEWSNFGNVHRFLLMHLRRSKQLDVYLRLDRRSPTPFIVPKLLRRKNGITPIDTVRHFNMRATCMRYVNCPAIHKVTLASSKSDLLNGQKAKAENRLVFAASSSLRAFRFFVSTISEELRDYRVWPVCHTSLPTTTSVHCVTFEGELVAAVHLGSRIPCGQ